MASKGLLLPCFIVRASPLTGGVHIIQFDAAQKDPGTAESLEP
jgi:hypothetical protein